ncbi:putative hydrolase [Cyphellophora attinorum]|uniref:Putative hydrolase n=1 Tax=Cyphellophora attinorum TaxID=1664694 RepID=A0A0N1H8G1_9EURO|nr:putative hydrolase [Phialophora attinorum]KPI43184.1 putative hydrolase [Phialophora attinorum]
MAPSKPGIAAALLLTAATASPIAQPSYNIDWQECNARKYPGLQCGVLKVPMDWDNSAASDTVLLDITRFPTNSSTRIGSLFVNPGGPGGPASGMCIAAADPNGAWTDAILSHFDIICPEPRGVGQTSAVKCDPEIWMETPSYFTDDQASFDTVTAFNKRLGSSCLNMTGPLLGYVDTMSAAKDLDAIRQALGEEKMNYLGYSYGTQLGSQYAELFPDKIRAMVLDGNLDHGQSAIEMFVDDNYAMEDEVRRLLDWCDNNSTCAFHNATGGAVKAWTDMIENANKHPIPAPGCGPSHAGEYTCKPNVTGYDIIFNLENYFPALDWEGVSQNIKEAMDGNATQLANPAPKNRENTTAALEFSNLAIGCLDWHMDVNTIEEHQARTLLGKSMFPLTLGSGMALQWATTCINWPFKPTNPQHELDPAAMSRAPPILLLQSTHDPATPLSGAQTLIKQIPSAVMVVRSGDGHTSYGPGSPEITKLTDAYLVNLTVPDKGTIVQDVAQNPGGGL